MNFKTMKTLFVILMPILLFACHSRQEKSDYPLFSEQQEPVKGEKAVIHGKISNLQVYPHVGEIQLILPDFSRTGEVHTSPIDSTGLFRFEIYPVATREISLNPIQDRLLVAPGDSLYIEHDFADFMNTRVSGKGSEVNNQITKFRGGYLGRYSFSYETLHMEYKKLCDKQLEETGEKLKLFQKENNTSEQFNQWAEKQVKMDYYTALFHFPFQHYLRTRETFPDTDDYYSFIPELEQTIDETMILTDYFQLMNWYTLLKLIGIDPEKEINAPPFSLEESVRLLYESTDNPFLAQFAVASYVGIETKSNRTESIDEIESELHPIITHPFLRASLQEEYNRVQKYRANPRVYSDAVLENNRREVFGANVLPEDSANVVKRLIATNPDRVLYIDVWATWCGPCIKQLPYSEELFKLFESEPITFVYLCTGGSRDEWKETIGRLDLSGVHLYLSDSERMDLMKRFNIKGIPHYLLFDREGVMVDYGIHLRPSIPETKTAIERSLTR